MFGETELGGPAEEWASWVPLKTGRSACYSAEPRVLRRCATDNRSQSWHLWDIFPCLYWDKSMFPVCSLSAVLFSDLLQSITGSAIMTFAETWLSFLLAGHLVSTALEGLQRTVPDVGK